MSTIPESVLLDDPKFVSITAQGFVLFAVDVNGDLWLSSETFAGEAYPSPWYTLWQRVPVATFPEEK